MSCYPSCFSVNTDPRAWSAAGEAAAVWRSEKLKDFSWRLRCLGLDQDLTFGALLAQISEQNAELEQMWQQQQQPGYEQPWWADGEYDELRADRWVAPGSMVDKSGSGWAKCN